FKDDDVLRVVQADVAAQRQPEFLTGVYPAGDRAGRRRTASQKYTDDQGQPHAAQCACAARRGQLQNGSGITEPVSPGRRLTEITVAFGKKLNSEALAQVYAPMARPTMRSPALSAGNMRFSAMTSMLSQVGPARTDGNFSSFSLSDSTGYLAWSKSWPLYEPYRPSSR